MVRFFACLVSVVLLVPAMAIAEEDHADLDALRSIFIAESLRERVILARRQVSEYESRRDRLVKLRPANADEANEALKTASDSFVAVSAQQKAVRQALTSLGGGDSKELREASAVLSKAEAAASAKEAAAIACQKAKCAADIREKVSAELTAAREARRIAHAAYDNAWNRFMETALHSPKLREMGRSVREAQRLVDALERRRPGMDPDLAWTIEYARALADVALAQLNYDRLRAELVATFPNATVSALLRLDGQLDTLIHGDGDERGFEELVKQLSRMLARRVAVDREP